MAVTAGSERRPLRTYVRREGRLTPGQRRALERLWPAYGVDPEGEPPWDLAALFGRQAPKVLEIGIGDGEALVALAGAAPEHDFLGSEVHRPGLGRCLLALEAAGLPNVRLAALDANELLARWIAPEALAGIYCLFPDPWPKKRHRKRRMVQPWWARLVAGRLAPGGFLHLATDWPDYAAQMRAVLDAEPGLVNEAGAGGYLAGRAGRPETKYERRGRARGHPVHDLRYRRAAVVEEG